MVTFLLSAMGAFAEYERALIRKRQREGITLAKKARVYMGRDQMLNVEQAGALIQCAAAGEAKAALAREFGVSRHAGAKLRQGCGGVPRPSGIPSQRAGKS